MSDKVNLIFFTVVLALYGEFLRLRDCLCLRGCLRLRDCLPSSLSSKVNLTFFTAVLALPYEPLRLREYLLPPFLISDSIGS